MDKYKKFALIVGIGIILLPGITFAKTRGPIRTKGMMGTMLAAVGVVSSTDGTTIDLSGNDQSEYFVDGSKVLNVDFSKIQVGDKLTIYGPTKDDNITATKIVDSTRSVVKKVTPIKTAKKVVKKKIVAKKVVK